MEASELFGYGIIALAAVLAIGVRNVGIVLLVVAGALCAAVAIFLAIGSNPAAVLAIVAIASFWGVGKLLGWRW